MDRIPRHVRDRIAVKARRPRRVRCTRLDLFLAAAVAEAEESRRAAAAAPTGGPPR